MGLLEVEGIDCDIYEPKLLVTGIIVVNEYLGQSLLGVRSGKL